MKESARAGKGSLSSLDIVTPHIDRPEVVGKRTRAMELGDAPASIASNQVTFALTSLAPGTGGPISATIDAGHLLVSSAEYRSTAVVGATGGDDRDAAAWDVGYLQTVVSDRVTAHYLGSAAVTRRTSAVPSNSRDGAWYGDPPWYDSTNGIAMRPLERTDSSVEVSLYDRPSKACLWHLDDGRAKLDRVEGKTRFATWVVARLRDAPNTIQFLAWETWEVDYGLSTDYARRGARAVAAITGATINTGSGPGLGAHRPDLTGPVAGDVNRVSQSAGAPAAGPGRRAPSQD